MYWDFKWSFEGCFERGVKWGFCMGTLYEDFKWYFVRDSKGDFEWGFCMGI